MDLFNPDFNMIYKNVESLATTYKINNDITNLNRLLLEYVDHVDLNNCDINYEHLHHLISCGANNFYECAIKTKSIAFIQFLLDSCDNIDVAKILRNSRKSILFDYYLIKKLKTYKFKNDYECYIFMHATNGEIFNHFPELLIKLSDWARPYVKIYNERRDLLLQILHDDLCRIVLDYVPYELLNYKPDLESMNIIYMLNLRPTYNAV